MSESEKSLVAVVNTKFFAKSFKIQVNLKYSFEKSCLSHKLFVTLSSVAVSRQKGRSRVNESFM